MVLFLLFNPQPSCGLKIFSSTVSPTYAAAGGNVTLSCHFNLAPQDTGVIDIEWSIKPTDVNLPETLVIWYAANRIFDNYEVFGSRVQFVSSSPATGNASISISHLKMTDTNTYQCKVRKLPGIQSHIIHMDVMERPTEPECYVEGVVELDCEVVFRCRSSRGSSPVWYRWSMDGTVAPGTLVCTAQNLVGMKSCLVAVSLKNSAVVAISTAVVWLTVFIIIIITALIVFRYKRRKIETFGNEILDDQLPPPCVSVCQRVSACVSVCQPVSACVSLCQLCQRVSACVSVCQPVSVCERERAACSRSTDRATSSSRFTPPSSHLKVGTS
uniref:Ig-like domain-containing protein n=1 Tax=Labrus bergylta TaxID=56723 RepID=A0A3Q3FGY4_9LABR